MVILMMLTRTSWSIRLEYIVFKPNSMDLWTCHVHRETTFDHPEIARSVGRKK